MILHTVRVSFKGKLKAITALGDHQKTYAGDYK